MKWSEIEKIILTDIINRDEVKSVIENKTQNEPSYKKKNINVEQYYSTYLR